MLNLRQFCFCVNSIIKVSEREQILKIKKDWRQFLWNLRPLCRWLRIKNTEKSIELDYEDGNFKCSFFCTSCCLLLSTRQTLCHLTAEDVFAGVSVYCQLRLNDKNIKTLKHSDLYAWQKFAHRFTCRVR